VWTWRWTKSFGATVTGPKGTASAVSIGGGSAYMGLFERVTIGVMIAWVMVMSIGFMRAERQATQRTAMATAAL